MGEQKNSINKKSELKVHDFEKAKKKLKKFSESAVQDISLSKITTYERVLGIFEKEHNVKGSEFNSVLTEIQELFMVNNNTHIKTRKEFIQVYNALEALDLDYIQQHILNIEATEKVANDAKKTAENVSKFVDQLQVFREKLEEYNHLEDIDELWDENQALHKNVEAVNECVESVNSKLDNAINYVNMKIDSEIDTANKAFLDKISELNDIISFQKKEIAVMERRMMQTKQMAWRRKK